MVEGVFCGASVPAIDYYSFRSIATQIPWTTKCAVESGRGHHRTRCHSRPFQEKRLSGMCGSQQLHAGQERTARINLSAEKAVGCASGSTQTPANERLSHTVYASLGKREHDLTGDERFLSAPNPLCRSGEDQPSTYADRCCDQFEPLSSVAAREANGTAADDTLRSTCTKGWVTLIVHGSNVKIRFNQQSLRLLYPYMQ